VAMLGAVLRLRRELAAAKRDTKMKNKLDQADEARNFPIQPS